MSREVEWVVGCKAERESAQARALWGGAVDRSWTSVAEGDAWNKTGQTEAGWTGKEPERSGNCSSQAKDGSQRVT